MSHPIRLFFEILGTLAALLLVGTGLLLWRLTAGPIQVPFVTPLLEAALARDPAGIRIDVGETSIDWSDRSRSIELRITNTRVAAADGREVARIPLAWVTLRARRLLAGEIQPEALRVDGLRVSLSRDADGKIAVLESTGDADADSNSASVAAFLLDELSGPTDPDRPLGLLSRATFLDATVAIRDAKSGLRVAAEHASVFFRRDQRGVALNAELPVDIGGQRIAAQFDALYVPQNEAADVEMRLAGISIAGLASVDPRLSALSGIEAVADIQVWTRLTADGRAEDTQVTLDSAGGRIADPALFPAPVALRTVALRARLSDDLSRIDLDELFADFGGPTARITGAVTDALGRPRVEMRAELAGVTTADVQRLWPLPAAKNARKWVVENLADGRVPSAKAEAVLHIDDEAWRKVVLDRVRLDFSVDGVTVRYLDGLPPVRGVAGDATLDAKKLEIKAHGGAIGPIRAEDATIRITELDQEDQNAVIAVHVKGPAPDILRVVDMKPLGFLGRIGEKPENFDGNADARLDLRFPLLNRLRLEQIAIVANGKVSEFSQQRAVLGEPVEEGAIDFRVDDKGLDVRGQVTLAGAAADIVYRREFSANADVVERARARGRADPEAQRRLGFNFVPYAYGTAGVDLTTQSFRDGRRDVSVDLDLADVALAVPDLDWKRGAGKALRARLQMALKNEVLRTIEVNEFAGEGVSARGRVEFDDAGKTWRSAELADVKLAGRADLRRFAARRAAPGGATSFDIAGDFLDVAPLLADKAKPAPDRPDLSVKIDLARLVLGEGREFDAFKADAHRGERRWETANLSARTAKSTAFPAGGDFSVRLDIGKGGNGRLDGHAEDAGALLKALDVTPNVVGGKFEIGGALDPARTDGAVVGKMSIENFRVVNAPGFARLLSVALLTGIVDSLRGEGIGFTRFDADFAWPDPRLEIRDGRMYGSALGVTARGVLDLDEETVDLEGTLVPAYAVNSILGNIPILGQLLVGERGSGVFAASYRAKGPTGDPQISVNPLSTLAPGFLRRLFGIFSGGGSALPAETPDPAPLENNTNQR
ncbi:MAG: hypothetical protein GC202_05215 [Alphaproteobacteria bacterium]|nr:hypothetical protein [Alphaproteobacteria bacterium]